jgi:hypothetical protein
MYTILVQMADETWTGQALHFACALARNNGARIILLRLMQVQQLSYLGTEFGSTPLSSREYAAWLGYAATAEDYGVELVRQSMQCWSKLDALADAADYVGAQVIFAYIPHSRIPYMDRLQRRGLQRRLGKANRQLYTLEPSAGNPGIPPIVMTPVPISTAHK